MPDTWIVPNKSIPLPRDAGCPRCSDPDGDYDRDGILNGEEGCRDCRDSRLRYRCAAFTAAFESGSASLKLDHVPASASLAVTLDSRDLKRAQPIGFDYRAADNTLLLRSTTFTRGRVLVSYQHWERYNPPY